MLSKSRGFVFSPVEVAHLRGIGDKFAITVCGLPLFFCERSLSLKVAYAHP